jgi:hypothetical protein
MANSLLHDISRDFWREVKKIRCHNKVNTSQNVDNCCSPDDIARFFKYRQLYSCVSYDHDEMSLITDFICVTYVLREKTYLRNTHNFTISYNIMYVFRFLMETKYLVV